MCGRIAYFHSWRDVYRFLRLELLDDPELWQRRYNVAPSQEIVTAIDVGDDVRVGSMRWGVQPDWAKRLIINAQSEKYLAPERHWWSTFRRCIVFASGFYEWRRSKDEKQPMYIQLSGGKLMPFAGLYTVEKADDGTRSGRAVVLTTNANELMKPIHHRMPAILLPEHVAEWINPETDRSLLSAALEPYPADEMETWPVSSRVNSVANDDPDLIKPIDTHEHG